MFSEIRKGMFFSIVLCVAAVLAFAPNSASSQQTVDQCGQTLSQSGQYLLKADLECTGFPNGVEITANDVVFNLAGHTIHSGECDPTRGIHGIYADGGLTGVRIEGGTVTGFNDGIVLGSSQSRVRAMNVTKACVFGIAIGGSGNQVDTSAITHSGLDGVGIGAGGHNRIAFNDISDNVRVGVDISNFSNDNVIEYNGINGNGLQAHEQGGIAIFNGTGNHLLHNVLHNNFEGIEIESPGNTAIGNVVIGSSDAGVGIMGGSPSVVRGNTVYGSTLVDMLDDQVACGTDTWTGNHFQTDLVHDASDGGPKSGCLR